MDYDKLHWDTEQRLENAVSGRSHYLSEDEEYFLDILKILEELEELKYRFNRVDRYLDKMRKSL